MRRLICVVACGLTLSACSGSMPAFEFFRPSPSTEQVRIESVPEGAEARSSQGPTCQTPCEFAMPPGSDFLVTVAMNGYLPVTVPVRPESLGARLQPNPVFVELQPAVPVAPGKMVSTKKKAKQGAKIQQ